MTALTNTLRAGGFIQSEANFSRSRDQVVLEGGSTAGFGVLVAGTVLGKLTSGGKYIPSPNTGADGSQTAVAVLYDTVDTSNGDVIAAVISRAAEVRAADLTYSSTVDDPTKKAAKATQLAAAGIIVRS